MLTFHHLLLTNCKYWYYLEMIKDSAETRRSASIFENLCDCLTMILFMRTNKFWAQLISVRYVRSFKNPAQDMVRSYVKFGPSYSNITSTDTTPLGVYIYRSRAILSTVPLFGFRTLQIGCLAYTSWSPLTVTCCHGRRACLQHY
jgi:hypothetical protein